MSTKPKKPVKKTWSGPALLREFRAVSKEVEILRNNTGVLLAQLGNLEKAHAELQKFYTQSQDELHACRERELMRPWWKKLLGLR